MVTRLPLLLLLALLSACATERSPARPPATTRDDPAVPEPGSGRRPSTAAAPDADETATGSDPASAPAPSDTQPTLRQIFAPPSLLGLRPADVAISADGRYVLYRWTAEDIEEPQRDWWLAATDGSGARVLFPHDAGATPQWTRTGSVLLVARDGWLDVLDVGVEEPVSRPLFEAGEDLGRIELLEDGRALVQTGDSHRLWLVDPGTGARRLLAEDLEDRSGWFEVEEQAGLVALFADDTGIGQPVEGESEDGDAAPAADVPADDAAPAPAAPRRLLHLVPLDGEGPIRTVDIEPDDGSVDLAPDGAWISVRNSESSAERELIMADYLTDHVSAVPVRSSLAGDDARREQLLLVDATTGERFTSPLDEAETYYVNSLQWEPSGSRLLVDRTSNDFHVRQVLVVDPRARRAWPVLSERDDAWVGGPLLWARWSDDGSEILFTSERTGFNHLYAVAPGGGEARALTAGDFEVMNVAPLEDSPSLLLLAGQPGDPAVHRLMLLDALTSDSRVLSPDDGCVIWPRWGRSSRPVISRDGDTVVFPFETLGVPADLYAVRLLPAGVGAPLRLTETAPAELAALALTPPELVVFRNPDDDVPVHAFLYRPEPFDPAAKYPAVVFVHGAGYLQNVTRSMTRYEVNMLFHQRLARRGFAVLDVDFRHSAGYGRDFRADVYGHMGGKDLDDVVAGVGFLEELGWVDVDRVGIYGGSYGGFLTLMALFTEPDVFACGAALRSVTDWRVYNHWYTNPRLGTPEDDAEAYALSSPIDHVDGLKNPLLLLHGLKDDNVFAQDTIRLMEELIQRGKEFDVMLYPSQGHAFTDPESWIDEYGRIEAYMDEHLRAADTAASDETPDA